MVFMKTVVKHVIGGIDSCSKYLFRKFFMSFCILYTAYSQEREGRKRQTRDIEGGISRPRTVWIKITKYEDRKINGRWTDCVFFYATVPKRFKSERKRETDRGHARVRGSWTMQHQAAIAGLWSRFSTLCFFSWKGLCSMQHAGSLSCIRIHYHAIARMHVKPCLICKAKLRVTPAVPAADCCHASLPSLLQAQTMTTQHQETTEHQNEVSSGLEDSQLQLSSNMLL